MQTQPMSLHFNIIGIVSSAPGGTPTTPQQSKWWGISSQLHRYVHTQNKQTNKVLNTHI